MACRFFSWNTLIHFWSNPLFSQTSGKMIQICHRQKRIEQSRLQNERTNPKPKESRILAAFKQETLICMGDPGAIGAWGHTSRGVPSTCRCCPLPHSGFLEGRSYLGGWVGMAGVTNPSSSGHLFPLPPQVCHYSFVWCILFSLLKEFEFSSFILGYLQCIKESFKFISFKLQPMSVPRHVCNPQRISKMNSIATGAVW